MHKKYHGVFRTLAILLISSSVFFTFPLWAKVKFIEEIDIADNALFFDGEQRKKNQGNPDLMSDDEYHFHFGSRISPHGDCIKIYKDYVFMTWYRGGKNDRHVMLTRYNKKTKKLKTIEFPHRHTGFRNQWWIGESHNTIAVGVSPLDGTIHLLYDMHAYGKDRPSDGALSEDYFRYSFSKANAATVPDEEFTIDLFVNDPDNEYKHLSLNQKDDYEQFSGLTYPTFFLTTEGDLLMYMRRGGNNNGGYVFSKYVASEKKWTDFIQWNTMDAKSQGMKHNWGLYGAMKYVNGQLRVGFQRRSANNNDKYKYQNGIYYAHSEMPDGSGGWKNHKGEAFNIPLIDSEKTFVTEPGDLVPETGKNQVVITHGFDWTATAKGDLHFISRIRYGKPQKSVNIHTYRPAGETKFITTNYNGGQQLYTSGDNIYVIGLADGRPHIDVAKGGTNDFKRVYQDKVGPKYKFGVVYIYEGVVYYYLMKAGEKGSALPTTLQIIDLGLNS